MAAEGEERVTGGARGEARGGGATSLLWRRAGARRHQGPDGGKEGTRGRSLVKEGAGPEEQR